MNSTDSPGTRRRIPAYFVVAIVIALAALFVVFWFARQRGGSGSAADRFVQFMQTGKNYYDSGDPGKAIDAWTEALKIQPSDHDAHLNLANAHLLAGQPEPALRHAQEALSRDHNSSAAHFVKGCAHLRLGQAEPASQSLQESVKLDTSVAAAHFQLGIAHQQLKQWNEAIASFQATVELEPAHPAAHYNLSQALLRAGRADEAQAELDMHQQLLAQAGQTTAKPETYERSIHTHARVPFKLEQPDATGIAVTFRDVTQQALGAVGNEAPLHGPVGVIDVLQDGISDLFVSEGDGFRLLVNSNGVFSALSDPVPGVPGATFTRCLVGDLQATSDLTVDRSEDALFIGPNGARVFKFTTNGFTTDASMTSRLTMHGAVDGALGDFDFTGKLDLLSITATNDLKLMRNLGNGSFVDRTATSGIPASVAGATRIVADYWNDDDMLDLIVAWRGEPPRLFIKERGGPFVPTNFVETLPVADLIALGDLNNDLRNDLVLGTADRIEIVFNGTNQRTNLVHGLKSLRSLTLVDYDNDGWLDVLVAGDGVRAWRNAGLNGFQDATSQLGFDKLQPGIIENITTADLDNDGDTDMLLEIGRERLQLLRNDGGNANLQVKVRLLGNRSNPSGLGCRVGVNAGGLRAMRTVTKLPIEIGVGQHKKLDALTVRWFNLDFPVVDFDVTPTSVVNIAEITLREGSCPFLYAWNGTQFSFVTDLLGAAPMGLPAAEGVYIDADVDEYVWMGGEDRVKPRGSNYVVQITEELREVLYLDQARLVVVDHAPDIDAYPTDKLVPRKPFPNGTVAPLRNPRAPQRAVRSDGLDVTRALAAADEQMVSPVRLRSPQLRGLAEPWSVTLDFGALDTTRPLVLAITGWLSFGGGMANIGASHNPDLPFPFPVLEAELPEGSWQKVDVIVGAPIGKTKRIVVDLEGKLAAGTRRLRIGTAFEIHWDRIALMEKASATAMRITELSPDKTDLHWRGFSAFKALPRSLPETPDYGVLSETPMWRVMPAGWSTRYGEVDELIAQKDDALVLINSGDELTLNFAESRLPEKPAGWKRDFFLFTVGWEKDSDFHVVRGLSVDPLPFHGMNDQLYGREPYPEHLDRTWIKKYNTRWVGPLTLKRSRQPSQP